MFCSSLCSCFSIHTDCTMRLHPVQVYALVSVYIQTIQCDCTLLKSMFLFQYTHRLYNATAPSYPDKAVNDFVSSLGTIVFSAWRQEISGPTGKRDSTESSLPTTYVVGRKLIFSVVFVRLFIRAHYPMMHWHRKEPSYPSRGKDQVERWTQLRLGWGPFLAKFSLGEPRPKLY